MPDVDRHLAGAIEARRIELGLDVQTLVDRTGLTRQGLQPLLRGERKRYQDRLKLPLCRELRWTPDSINRLLKGLEPIPLPEPEPAPDPIVEAVRRLGELEDGQADLAAQLAAFQSTRREAFELMLARFEAMEERVDHIERLAERAHVAAEDDSGESV